MSIDARIVDGTNTKQAAEVDDNNCLKEVGWPEPPLEYTQKLRVFRQHLTDDGLPTDGSNQDMTVDGSSNNVDFYIGSSDTSDRFITMISFLIADAGATLNEFGNISALSNGCRLFYTDSAGEVDIADSLTTQFEVIRLCVGDPPFGDAAAAFRS